MAGWMEVDAAVHGACSVLAGAAGARFARSDATAVNSTADWFTIANAVSRYLRSALLPFSLRGVWVVMLLHRLKVFHLIKGFNLVEATGGDGLENGDGVGNSFDHCIAPLCFFALCLCALYLALC
jgi:hypothetical protein